MEKFRLKEFFCLTNSPVSIKQCLHGRLAQLGEHRPYKPRVAGSIPAPPTTPLFKGNANAEQ